MAVSLPSPVLTLLRDVMLMKYMNFIAFTMLAYDYILTFSDEVRYIWRREWRAGKVFYIATKYPAFIDSGLFLTFWFDLKLNAQGCRRIFNAGTWFMTAGTIIAEWILCMRTNAIWGKSKKVFVPLVIFVFAAQIGGVYAVKSLQSSLEWSLSPFPTISRCYINVTRPNLLYTVYVCTMGKEFVIFALTLWKGVSQWKTSRSPLINTLYRDGVLYFFIMFAISLTNFVMAIVGPKVQQTMLAFLMPEVQRVLHSVCTSHILLNLRKASDGDGGLGLDDGIGAILQVSTMRFGANRAEPGKQARPSPVPVANDGYESTGFTTIKTDEWAAEMSTETDTFAMTESHHLVP